MNFKKAGLLQLQKVGSGVLSDQDTSLTPEQNPQGKFFGSESEQKAWAAGVDAQV